MPAISITWSNFKQLLANIRWTFNLAWSTNPPLFLGLLAATAVRSILPAAIALVSRNFINSVADMLSDATQEPDELIFWLVISAVVAAISAVSNVSNAYCTNRLQDELNLVITSDFLNHATKLDYAYFEDPESIDVMHRARNNMAQHFTRMLTVTLSIITNLIQIVTLIIILVMIEPLVILLLGPVSLVYLVFNWRYARKRFAEDHSRASQKRWTQYYVGQLTNYTSVSQVKLLGLGPLFIDQFQSIVSDFRDRNRKLHLYAFVGGLIFAVVSVVAVYLAFALATLKVIAGGLTIGDVAIYGGSVVRLRGAAESIIGWLGDLRWRTYFVSNLQQFLAARPEMPQAGEIVPENSRGEVELQGVNFTYPGAKMPALQEISLQINQGEIVAVVGENGAGKTTLVKLLTRLYDPDEGRVCFDGVDLRELAPEYRQQQISFVFQQYERYAATAADNIAYGDWQHLLHDREKIEEIAKKAAVHPMIESMPHGYDTMLGRHFGEYNLSGGQWQRLAIARAFARDSSLVILDEPTANLDARAEYQIFSDFKELSKGRTTILISHRFSTVSVADRILVMHEGQIIESGTHERLMTAGGHYATLYNLHRLQMETEEMSGSRKE